MTTQEIIRAVWLNELSALAMLIALVVGTVLVLRYVDRRWTFIPRKRQRVRFNERGL
jgi:uncharacterized iron-regulated membrane protein